MKIAIFANSVDLDEGGQGLEYCGVGEGGGGRQGEAKFPAGT